MIDLLTVQVELQDLMLKVCRTAFWGTLQPQQHILQLIQPAFLKYMVPCPAQVSLFKVRWPPLLSEIWVARLHLSRVRVFGFSCLGCENDDHEGKILHGRTLTPIIGMFVVTLKCAVGEAFPL